MNTPFTHKLCGNTCCYIHVLMFCFWLVESYVSHYIKWIIWLSFSWALTVHFSLSKSNNPLLSCLGKIGTVNFQTQIGTNLFLKSSIKSQDVEWMNSRNAWQSLFKLLYICFIFFLQTILFHALTLSWRISK